jgi:hypothetical protein
MAIDSIPEVIQCAFVHRLPPKIDYGIAFIGCGGIVNYGHIPSYQASGFRLLGGYDQDYEAAEKTVRVHGLGEVLL